MQLGGVSRVGGPAAVITAVTLVMLGAMAFAVPPSRIQVDETVAQRGYLVPHSRFSAVLASNLAAGGYTYLAVDLTDAELGEGGHWSDHLDRINEVQFPVWGWIELKSATELEAIRLAQVATVAHASAKDALEAFDKDDSLARKDIEAIVQKTAAEKGLKAADVKKKIAELVAEARKPFAEAEQEAAKEMAAARVAAKHASAEWKLNEMVPGLNLRGIYLAGPGAVARARQFAASNPSMTVLAVVGAGGEAPEGAHAVAFNADAFAEEAGDAEYPILEAAGMKLADIEKLRRAVGGNYLVATVPVPR